MNQRSGDNKPWRNSPKSGNIPDGAPYEVKVSRPVQSGGKGRERKRKALPITINPSSRAGRRKFGRTKKYGKRCQ